MIATFSPSAATESDIQLYAEGSCHAFALALHRELGMGFVVVLDPDERYWEDDADADNFISAVVHVYAVDSDGNAWDVRGVRPEGLILADVAEHYPDVRAPERDEFSGEFGLRTYVDGLVAADPEDEPGEEIDRPLHSVTDADVAEALDCARRVLGVLPGFPQAYSAPSP